MRINHCGRIVDGTCPRRSSQFVGSHAPAEHVARCALMTVARIGAALESVLELGSAVEQRNPVGVRVVSVCRRVSVSGR